MEKYENRISKILKKYLYFLSRKIIKLKNDFNFKVENKKNR